MGRKLCDNYVYDKDCSTYVAQSVERMFMAKRNVASVWHVTSVIAATNYLVACCDGENKEFFADVNAKLWGNLTYYAGTAEIVTYSSKSVQRMFAVNRAEQAEKADISGIKAVYDDQMWLIREALQTYKNTSERKYLEQAEALAETCLDGWDYSTDGNGREFGGITWGAEYASKHSCSNAPLIAPLVDLYEIYIDSSPEKADYYLNFAKKIYDFCRATFENSEGVYGDLIGTEFITDDDGIKHTTSHGTLDPTAYTYNTGSVLQGAAKLYKATGDVGYIEYARSLADIAHGFFAKTDSSTGLVQYDTDNNAWFNFQLLLGYIELQKADTEKQGNVRQYIGEFEQTLNYACEFYYDRGLLPRDLIGGWSLRNEDRNKDVLDSAAYVEMLTAILLLGE